MMECWCGDRGSSKTYNISSEIMEKRKDGYFIISNMWHEDADVIISKKRPEDVFEVIKEILVLKNRGYEMVDFSPEYTHTGIYLVIDEAHLFFSADLYKRYSKPENAYLINFMSQARKIDCHAVLSVQDPSKLDKNWRRYVEDYYECVPLVPIRYWKKSWKTTVKGNECYSRVMRYPIPIAKVIKHKLKAEQPYFSEQQFGDPSGFGTRVNIRLRRFGWLRPAPYKKYNSQELIGVDVDNINLVDFPILKSFSTPSQRFEKLKDSLKVPPVQQPGSVERPARSRKEARKAVEKMGINVEKVQPVVALQTKKFIDRL